ncbi:hypothetical protein DFH11DRAFT_1583421 [Phellopilus nigrolimitatus]|nr:hypothetical protein DFH11DRAFT_1583421 [Phellopilus nigrolimitatus]
MRQRVPTHPGNARPALGSRASIEYSRFSSFGAALASGALRVGLASGPYRTPSAASKCLVNPVINSVYYYFGDSVRLSSDSSDVQKRRGLEGIRYNVQSFRASASRHVPCGDYGRRRALPDHATRAQYCLLPVCGYHLLNDVIMYKVHDQFLTGFVCFSLPSEHYLRTPTGLAVSIIQAKQRARPSCVFLDPHELGSCTSNEFDMISLQEDRPRGGAASTELSTAVEHMQNARYGVPKRETITNLTKRIARYLLRVYE